MHVYTILYPHVYTTLYPHVYINRNALVSNMLTLIFEIYYNNFYMLSLYTCLHLSFVYRFLSISLQTPYLCTPLHKLFYTCFHMFTYISTKQTAKLDIFPNNSSFYYMMITFATICTNSACYTHNLGEMLNLLFPCFPDQYISLYLDLQQTFLGR